MWSYFKVFAIHLFICAEIFAHRIIPHTKKEKKGIDRKKEEKGKAHEIEWTRTMWLV